MNLSSYGQTISTLTAAAHGLYGGPAIAESALDSKFHAIDGIDTKALSEHALRAAGSSNSAQMEKWLGPVLKIIAEVGAGMVAAELLERAKEWFRGREKVAEVADASCRAADAIDTTVQESEQGISAILGQLAEIIAEITNYLSTIDPVEHAAAFASAVEAGASIIDEAASMIAGLCQDRDLAVSECFGALIQHAQLACEDTQTTQQSISVGSSSSDASAVCAASSGSSQTTKAGCHDTGVNEQTEYQEELNQAQADEVECLSDRQTSGIANVLGVFGGLGAWGVIGAAGIGLLSAGAGAFVQLLEQLCQHVDEEIPCPEPTEVAENTVVESTSLPAESPVVPIKEELPQTKPPEEELARVPEPAPKPIPVSVESPDNSQPASVPKSPGNESVHILKAGGW